MTDPFYLAALPDAWEILGVKLRPFSLGHVLLLHRIGSPFVGGKVSTPFDDLALAVLLCSETYAVGKSIIERDDLSDILRRWADHLTGMDRWSVRLGWRPALVPDFSTAAGDFTEYVREHSRIPSYDFNPADFTELHCPEAQVVKVTLMRDMHFTEAELLDRAWGLCLWDYVTLRALDGRVKMVDPGDKDAALNLANDLLARIQAGEIKIPRT